MNDFSNASQTIFAFLRLLKFEEDKKTSPLFNNAAILQDLNQLNLDLNEISHPNEIALAILGLCEKNPEIERLLISSKLWSKFRSCMVDEDDGDIPLLPTQGEAEIIRNRDRIQKIIQENQRQPDPDLPKNPEQD
jgi:hypothetical protein